MTNILTINGGTREITTHTAHRFFFSIASYRYSGSITVMLQRKQKIELFHSI